MVNHPHIRIPTSPLTAVVITGVLGALLSQSALAQTCPGANEYTQMGGNFPKSGSALTANNQFQFSYSGQYTSFPAVKFYIPPGTTEFNLKGFLSQQVPYAVVTRLGKPPVRTNAVDGNVSSGEYGAINASSTKNTLAARLLGGEEMVFVHDGGGNTTYGDANLFRWPLLKGIWLYTRVLTGYDIYGLQGSSTVDRTLFTSLIANTAYDSAGLIPSEDCNLPVKPTGIQLNTPTIQAGGSGEVKPIPSNALVIGECSADPTSPIAPYIQFTNYTFKVLDGAPTGAVNIGCGNATDPSSGVSMLSWPSVVQPKFTTTLTVGNPQPLSSISLSSPATLKASTPQQVITITAQPAGASLGSCTVSDSTLATVSGTSLSLTDAGKAITAPRTLTLDCSGKTASFNIEPLPTLSLSPSTLIQGSTTGAAVSKSDGTAPANCTFTGAGSFNPNAYLDWVAASGTIRFKTGASTLTATQSVRVTCDGTQSAALVLDPAPVGMLYPLHNDEVGVTPKPTRDPKQLLLRWREADTLGATTDHALSSKYPSFPTTDSNSTFECRDSTGNFSLDTSTTPSTSLALVEKTRSTSVTTKITCWVQDRFTFLQQPDTLKSTPPIRILTDNTWEIAQPTKDLPILDASDSSSAKFQLYVPTSTSTSTSNVPVVIMGYVPRSPSVPWDNDSRTEVMLTPSGWKFWTGQENEADLIYTTISNSQPNRVMEVNLAFPKATFAGLNAKVAVFYKDGLTWQTLTNSNTEWDATK